MFVVNLDKEMVIEFVKYELYCSDDDELHDELSYLYGRDIFIDINNLTDDVYLEIYLILKDIEHPLNIKE